MKYKHITENVTFRNVVLYQVCHLKSRKDEFYDDSHKTTILEQDLTTMVF